MISSIVDRILFFAGANAAFGLPAILGWFLTAAASVSLVVAGRSVKNWGRADGRVSPVRLTARLAAIIAPIAALGLAIVCASAALVHLVSIVDWPDRFTIPFLAAVPVIFFGALFVTRRNNPSRFSKVFSAIVLAAYCGTIALSGIAMNLFFMVVEPEYIIPEESTKSWFKPRVMNSGSGDWWESAEDGTNFYYRTDSDGIVYSIFPRSGAANCPGFNPDVLSTWCSSSRVNRMKSELSREGW